MAVTDCVAKTCTPKEALTTLQYTAQTCDFPIRSRANIARSIGWTLFAISLLSIGLRFIARSPHFHGPGYGWDDWAMLVVLAFLVGHEIVVEKCTPQLFSATNFEANIVDLVVQNGLGRDVWTLVPHWQTMTNFLYVR